MTFFCISQIRDILEEYLFDLKAFLPRMLFAVALLPFPVRPTKTRVFSSLHQDLRSIISNSGCNCKLKIT